jgi:membrane fusion protein, multidrug efflux system
MLPLYSPILTGEVEAKITAVSRYINTLNRTFLVEVKLDPKKDGFKANMIAILKITDYINPKALCIPVKYIQSDLDGDFVFIAETTDEGNYTKRVAIKQGLSYNGLVEITEGLKEGDKIITSGYLELEDGEEINL